MGLIREVIPRLEGAAGAEGGSSEPGAMAVRGGDFLFVSGLTAADPQAGEPAAGTTAGETRQVLMTLERLLEAAGSSLDKVVKVNVLLDSMLEAPNMNEVYARFFPDPPPARTVCGARLPPGVKVMIECTALA
jgi:2-iminobutanoate/2-iminopropanoate deaminase